MVKTTGLRPAILTEWGLHADWVVKPLLDAGYTVTGCEIDRIPALLATGQYNVLILGRYALWRKTKSEELAAIRTLGAAIEEFTAKGGGVFFAAPGISVIPVDALFTPLGLRLPHLGIEQSENTVTCADQRYGYSTELSGPLAAGVAGIWYPVDLGPATAIWPLQVVDGAPWQVIARTAHGSHTTGLTSEDYGLPPEGEDAKLYVDTVPILAARDVARGRVAVCGIPAGFFLFSPHNFPTARRMLSDGFADQPSGLRQLVFNILAWLAAPSLAAGTLGGGETHPRVLLPQVPHFPDDPPVIWPVTAFPQDGQPRRGLIGARTRYSTGYSTVAEYVQKAQNAGLDFIVFLEEFPALDTEKFQALKAECRAHTTEAFFAVPGYTIADCVGTHCFVYGFEAALPLPDILAADGKTLATHPENNGRSAARVESLHCNLIFGELKMRCRKGVYRHTATPKLFIEHRFNDSIAVVTWEDGQLIDDVRDRYRLLMDKGLRLNPTVLTLLQRADDIDRALAGGWHNTFIEPYATIQDTVLRKHMAPELEWWGTIKAEITRSPRYRFDCWQYGNPFQVATGGPEILAWAVSVSQRDTVWRSTDAEIPPTADWFRVDVASFRLRMKVVSDVGLDEVCLYDGTRLLRRWHGEGALTFERELPLTHHQQMHLLLEARDMRGGVAQTADFLTYRRDWCEFYCADRNNPLTIGFEKDARGLAYGWSGAEHLTYNNGHWGGGSPSTGRWWYGGDKLYPVPNDPVHDLITPLDGGVSESAAGLHLQVRMPELDPPELGLMVDPVQEMISTDVAISGYTVENGYDLSQPYFHGTDNTGFGLFGGYPTRYVRLRRRKIVFRPKPHALTTLILQADLCWRRDPVLTAPLPIGWLDAHPAHVLHRANGERLELPGQADDNLSVCWQRGDALVSWTDGARPAIFLNDGAELLLVREPGGYLGLRLPVEELPVADRATRIRVIGIGGTIAHRDPDIVDHVSTAMGLRGEPAYRIAMEQGSVQATCLFLELDGRDGGTAFTIPRADLPMALPLIVDNLNENWSAILFDRTACRWRPLGLLEGRAYATLDTAAGDQCVFLGHPFVADHPAVVLHLTQHSEYELQLEAHNPTDTPLATTIRRSPFFTLVEWPQQSVQLLPGESRLFALSSPEGG